MINITDRKSNIPIYLAMILPVFTGLGSGVSNLIAVIELIISLYYFSSDKFWLITPIVCIYQSQLVLVGERIELFAVYGMICLARLVMSERTLKKSGMQNKIIFAVLMLYACMVMVFWGETWAGIEMFLQTITIVYATYCIHSNEQLYINLKRVVIFMCFSAALYGVLFANIKGGYEEQATIVQYGARYSGTTGDPNYMAFYYCVAFCFLVFMEMKHQWIKRFLMLGLFVAMALTGSLTGLLTIALTMLLYMLFAKEVKKRYKILTTMLIISIVSLFVWYIVTNRTEIEILNLYRDRILEKVDYVNQGNLVGLTTGRTELSRKYIEYLFGENIFRVLFGGYQLNAMGLIGEAADLIRWGAHNSYVDVLMTTGLIGMLFFICSMLWKAIHHLRGWIYTKETYKIEGFVYCVIVGFFIMGLSV